MSQEVRGVVAHKKGDPVSVETIVIPDPGPGEAVVKIQACGVCHTDLHYREGGINDEFPFLLGHEAAGIVETVGEGVTDLAPGDFVILNWRAVCGQCRACHRGEPWYCFNTHNAAQKMTLESGQELSPALGIGAFVEKTLVHAGQCTKVNPAVKPEVAGLLGCGVMAGIGAAINTGNMLLVAIFFVSGADAASIVMGTLSQRGTIHPTRNVVVFWGAVMGAIGAVMLLVGGGKGDALSGIQNITIIMAAPFAVVMVLMCVSLARDLRNDPLVRRGLRSARAIEQAVEFGQREYGDAFFVPVKPHPIERPFSVDDGTTDGSAAPTTRHEESAGPPAEEPNGDRVRARARAEEATS